MANSTGSLSFRSEVDLWFIVITAVFVSVTGIAAWRMITQGAIVPAAVVLLAIGLFAWLLFGTAYVLTDDNQLIVRSGPMRRTLDVASIRSVKPTNSIWSAPALSLNRLEIMTEGGPLVISPADRGRFLGELVRRAPGIRLEGVSPSTSSARPAS
jgi:hypothetical protein